MLAMLYHNINMSKHQASFNPDWTKEHEFISKKHNFSGFCTLCHCEVDVSSQGKAAIATCQHGKT